MLIAHTKSMIINRSSASPTPSVAQTRSTTKPNSTTSANSVSGQPTNVDVFERSTSSHSTTRTAAVNLAPQEPATSPSKYWTNPRRTMDVDIDGYDFDFEPRQQLSGNRAKGFVDGPFNLSLIHI